MQDFMNDCFIPALKAAIEQGRKRTVVKPEKYKTLLAVYEQMQQVFGVSPTLKLNPAFASGSVEVKVPTVALDKKAMLQLKKLLSSCGALEIVPLVGEVLSVAVTIWQVYEEEERSV